VIAPTLYGAQVNVRPWRESEAQLYVAGRDDLIYRWTSERRDLTAEAAAAAIRAAADETDGIGFAIVDAVTDAPVGNLPVRFREGGTAVVGYWVMASARGRGVASEAVQILSEWILGNEMASSVELEIDATNEASRAVAARCGFVECGTRRTDPPDDKLVYRRM